MKTTLSFRISKKQVALQFLALNVVARKKNISQFYGHIGQPAIFALKMIKVDLRARVRMKRLVNAHLQAVFGSLLWSISSICIIIKMQVVHLENEFCIGARRLHYIYMLRLAGLSLALDDAC